MSRARQGKFQLPQPPVVVDVGCSCRTPRLLSSLVSSLKSHARGLGLGLGGKPKQSHPQHASSAWSSSTATAFTPSAISTSATTASSLQDYHAASWGPATYAATANALYDEEASFADAEAARGQQRRCRRRRRRRQRSRMESWTAVGEETAVAVEVDSAAPYEDFRESMVAMVREKEMYAWEDLNALLHQFLALNSPRHHALILGAFADLWTPRGGLFCPPSPCLL
ncbi:hypothetical protein PR202_ga05272 [Eleusine coracana subsp. coracana]|uniref:Transcription repressor n=1 Tax=Eleusine coracana subsp. coracana TaxID=191504 RepID=A0AAV5BTA8_ELECO|nr:hypothetical protein QOZ80_5AG0371530 [Eleusine coracana subsp. coracana]GJM88720.1 hypothetical protein PR202_ga04818 [Eleusine coracana subsp. coracana]GJM89122.1 hypothetical protein PR202_ga05272 [Eleusine coracana subsp. coracana]